MIGSSADEGQRARLCQILLGPLCDHFHAAAEAYADYLSDGKTFRSACRLRTINAAARQLLSDHRDLLPQPLQDHATALVRHYDVWMKLWDQLASENEPAMEDAFVFDNPVRFPRASQQALAELYEQWTR